MEQKACRLHQLRLCDGSALCRTVTGRCCGASNGAHSERYSYAIRRSRGRWQGDARERDIRALRGACDRTYRPASVVGKGAERGTTKVRMIYSMNYKLLTSN